MRDTTLIMKEFYYANKGSKPDKIGEVAGQSDRLPLFHLYPAKCMFIGRKERMNRN